MIRALAFAIVGLAVTVHATLTAQQPDFPEPGKEHQWLNQFVGTWETHSEGSMGPDQPPVICKGILSARMLGGFWLVNETKADIDGTPFTAVQTIGYDPAKKQYVGTWVDSMTSYMWQYEGTVDETGKTLTLEAEGPNPMDQGKHAKFRDTFHFESADTVTATSLIFDDGKWVPIMVGHMTRK